MPEMAERNAPGALAAVFRAAAAVRISRQLSFRNYLHNRAAECGTVAGACCCLSGQALAPLAEFRYGAAGFASAGCGVIAACNALRLLGRVEPLADVCRELEELGAPMLLGLLGTNPYTVEALLTRRGIPFLRSREPEVLAAAVAGRGQGVLLLTFWNRRGHPLRGIHTVAVGYDPAQARPFTAYNRFGNVPRPMSYAALAEVPEAGKLIVGYLLG